MIDFTISLTGNEWTELLKIAFAYLMGVFILMPKKLRWSSDKIKKQYERQKKEYIKKKGK